METHLFDYDLPPECIAQKPSKHRDESRLLVVNRKSQEITHHIFNELHNLIPINTSLFRNNVAVRKARLYGYRESGGFVECLLLEATDSDLWRCLLKPAKKLKTGSSFRINNVFQATVIQRESNNTFLINFDIKNDLSVEQFCQQNGQIPLPPYIQRTSSETADSIDEQRYQTVYADPQETHAAAAPTAGLHFTPELITKLKDAAFPIYDLTLHIGPGTFQPIKEEQLEAHTMHEESYQLPQETLQTLCDSHSLPRLAIGTTALRAMEDFSRKWKQKPSISQETQKGFSSKTDIFIYPPEEFYSVDSLLTNFHLPQSTLMCLVSAFLSPENSEGIKWLKAIYREAINANYRFYSYGDAMLIL